jgi:hypothetical protein
MGLRCDPALALTTSLGFLMGKPSGAFPLEIWAVSEGVKTEKVLTDFLEMGRVALEPIEACWVLGKA